MAPAEYMLTITLSPQVIAHHRIKGQLKLSYKKIKESFESGKGCIEFTKQGNVHYHIKTVDDLSTIYIFLDSLKGVTCQINAKRVPVYGFTKCDKTNNDDMVGDYEYLLKNVVQTDQVLKKLRLSENYSSCWEFTKKKTKYNDCYDKMKQCLGDLDRCISDTEEIINEIDVQRDIIEQWIT
jgi:hypothetical protein